MSDDRNDNSRDELWELFGLFTFVGLIVGCVLLAVWVSGL